MKKSELRQFIKEELQTITEERTLDDFKAKIYGHGKQESMSKVEAIKLFYMWTKTGTLSLKTFATILSEWGSLNGIFSGLKWSK